MVHLILGRSLVIVYYAGFRIRSSRPKVKTDVKSIYIMFVGLKNIGTL